MNNKFSSRWCCAAELSLYTEIFYDLFLYTYNYPLPNYIINIASSWAWTCYVGIFKIRTHDICIHDICIVDLFLVFNVPRSTFFFPGYRSGDYQSRYGYNSAGSSQNRGPWLSGFGPPNFPPYEYQQQRNHYNNHHQAQSGRNNYQNTQQGYQSQGVCFFHFYSHPDI